MLEAGKTPPRKGPEKEKDKPNGGSREGAA